AQKCVQKTKQSFVPRTVEKSTALLSAKTVKFVVSKVHPVEEVLKEPFDKKAYKEARQLAYQQFLAQKTADLKTAFERKTIEFHQERTAEAIENAVFQIPVREKQREHSVVLKKHLEQL